MKWCPLSPGFPTFNLGVRTYLEVGQKASARTAWSWARMHRYGSRVSDLSASCTRKSVDLEVRSHSPTTPGESRRLSYPACEDGWRWTIRLLTPFTNSHHHRIPPPWYCEVWQAARPWTEPARSCRGEGLYRSPASASTHRRSAEDNSITSSPTVDL